ncbi:MAG TPA: sigma 54-interacting transcriptional regulator [Planctomycetota bacterium]|nr:sigma 54-interacting transcriptional regulator [Planctomycetota bacterium]
MPLGKRHEQSTTDQYRLLILGDGTVRTVPLVGSSWVIGRGPDASIPVRDPTVSRRHLLLERKGATFRFQDVGSSNPVLLDGRVVKHGTLEVGQTLSIGLTRLTLERRERPEPTATYPRSTVILSREIVDEELPHGHPGSFAAAAERVLERFEWTFTDAGDLTDAAEPLLDLALNLTSRRRGWLGRFTPPDGVVTLAMLDTVANRRQVAVPQAVLDDARCITRPHLLTMREADGTMNRLVIPFGDGPEGALVLEDAAASAPAGQDLLRLSQVLGTVVWHRLQETTERLRLREELQRLQFRGTTAHNALIACGRLQEARQLLRTHARSDSPVLLVGEDGTEREALARYLHTEGARHQAPFVSVNLGVLPEARRAKELFGDSRGVPGAVHRARNGMLFIDELPRLSRPLQQRLIDELRQARGRGLAAAPLLVVAAGAAPDRSTEIWLPALADWLEPQTVYVPPLRTDARDVLALAELFLSELGTASHGTPRFLTERSKRLLTAYSWPGNVRELRQVIETAAARAGSLPIAPRHLAPHVANALTAPAATDLPSLEDVERRHIEEVMRRTGGNRSRAAQILGIASSTLYQKLKRHAIDD